MNNVFIFEDNKKRYDFIIVIPTINKEENNKRREKIIKIIQDSLKNKKFIYNIYLAIDGRDWSEAINISFKKLKNRVRTGLILLDDDSFPFYDWMNNFEIYLEEYGKEIMQFSLVNKNGIISGGSKLIKVNNFQKSVIQLLCNQFISGDYWTYNTYKKSYDYKIKHAMTISSACFSAVYLPKKAIYSLKVHDRIKDKRIRYYEDGDFSYNAISRGYKIYNIPGRVFHFGGETKSKSENIFLDSEYSRLWIFRWFTNFEFLKKINEQGLVIKLNFLIILFKEILLRIRLKKIKKSFYKYLKLSNIYP